MCLDKIERSNFLRFLCLFIDIGTETLLTLFLHFVSQENVVSFFLSDDVQRKCKDLQSRKILTKKQLKIISHSCPDIHTFDISLFIVLLSNLFSEKVITPPQGGWETNRPRKNDHSLAANIVRMRLLRNAVVGHSSRAKLSDIYFQELWEELKGIVVSIYSVIDTKSLDDICGKVESYKTIQLDAQNERQYEDKLRNLKETCIDIVEMQEKVADLLQKSQEFAKFFRCKPKRFSRYVNLLVDGGRLVLRACLQRTLSKLNLDIHTVLSEKSADLNRELGDGVQQLNEAIDEWDVHALTTVMLVCFGDNVVPEVKEAIAYIQYSLRGYAKLAVESLDAERFSHIDGDLVYNLRILSLDLRADIQSKCKEMIDIHRKQQREENEPHSEANFDLLKSHGLKLKSLEDVYKETLIQLKEEIKKMDEKGIPFKNDYVLQLQLMTYGEKKKMAEDILTTVITAALHNNESTAECEDIRKAIDLILAQINNISGVKVETVERHCILISISCSSSPGVLKLIEHIDSTYFQEQLFMLSSELIAHFGEELVVTGNFNFETLHDLDIYLSLCSQSEHEPGGLTLPVTCSSAEGLNNLLKLMTADATTNSVNQIAEQLSLQVQDKISLEVDFPDLRQFIRVLGDNGTKMSLSQSETIRAEIMSTNIIDDKDTVGLVKDSELSDVEALPLNLDDQIHKISTILETTVDKIETKFNDRLRQMDQISTEAAKKLEKNFCEKMEEMEKRMRETTERMRDMSEHKLKKEVDKLTSACEKMEAMENRMKITQEASEKLVKTLCEKMEEMEKGMESTVFSWMTAERMRERSEHNNLKKEVDKLTSACEKMEAMENRIKITQEASEKLEKNFRGKNEDMRKIMESTVSSWNAAERMRERSELNLKKEVDKLTSACEKMEATEKRIKNNKLEFDVALAEFRSTLQSNKTAMGIAMERSEQEHRKKNRRRKSPHEIKDKLEMSDSPRYSVKHYASTDLLPTRYQDASQEEGPSQYFRELKRKSSNETMDEFISRNCLKPKRDAPEGERNLFAPSWSRVSALHTPAFPTFPLSASIEENLPERGINLLRSTNMYKNPDRSGIEVVFRSSYKSDIEDQQSTYDSDYGSTCSPSSGKL